MIFVLNKQKEAVGILTNNTQNGLNFWDDVLTENIENNLETFEFKVNPDNSQAHILEVEGYIIYTTRNNDRKLFVIKKIEDSSSNTKERYVYCENAIIDNLINTIVRPAKFNSGSLKEIITYVLTNTSWDFTIDDNDKRFDFEITEFKTALELLKEIAELFEMEYYTDVGMYFNKIETQYIRFVQKKGTETGRIFEYSKDLLSVKKTEDTNDLCTAVIAVGQSTSDVEGSYTTFINYDLAAAGILKYGFLQSGDFIYDPVAFQKYNKDGRHLFRTINVDSSSQMDLGKEAVKFLKENNEPKLTYEVNAVNLDKMTGWESKRVFIGDTVVIKDFSINPAIIVEARVMELKRSLVNSLEDSITFGNFKPVEKTNNKIVKQLENKFLKNEKTWTNSGAIAKESLTKAQTAEQKAITAETKAVEAKTIVDEAKENITVAVNKAEEAMTAAAEVVNDIENINNDLTNKVNSNEVIEVINNSEEEILLNPEKVELTEYIEVDHINNLNGLNVNNQFVIDEEGNVSFSGNLAAASGNFEGSLKSSRDTVWGYDELDVDFGILNLMNRSYSMEQHLIDPDGYDEPGNIEIVVNEDFGTVSKIQIVPEADGLGGRIKFWKSYYENIDVEGWDEPFEETEEIAEAGIIFSGKGTNFGSKGLTSTITFDTTDISNTLTGKGEVHSSGTFVLDSGYLELYPFSDNQGYGSRAQVHYNHNLKTLNFFQRDLEGVVGEMDINFNGMILTEDYKNVSFQAGWSNNGGNYHNIGYMKDKQNTVHLRGLAKRETNGGQTIFYLPSGYRPSKTLSFIVSFGTTIYGRVDIGSSGSVYVYQTTNLPGLVSLDNISFKI